MKIEDSYKSSLADTDYDYENNQKYIFKNHHSNVASYTFNYLIRIFPYSLIGIEYMGNCLGPANKLFYSIKKTMENTLSKKYDLREIIPEMYYFPDLFSNKNELKFEKLINGEEIDNVLFNDENGEQYSKYEFLTYLRNYLEYGNLYINDWIDLIFGKNQKEDGERKYYSSGMYVHINHKKQEEYLNNSLSMEKYEFGIQPLRFFKEKFPELINRKEIIKYINKI